MWGITFDLCVNLLSSHFVRKTAPPNGMIGLSARSRPHRWRSKEKTYPAWFGVMESILAAVTRSSLQLQRNISTRSLPSGVLENPLNKLPLRMEHFIRHPGHLLGKTIMFNSFSPCRLSDCRRLSTIGVKFAQSINMANFPGYHNHILDIGHISVGWLKDDVLASK